MQESRLRELLNSFRNLRIGVIGDFCIDAFWLLSQEQPEHSLETGKITHPVKRHSYTLGGAGNVVKNLVDLGVGEVWTFGVIGEDVFSDLMLKLLLAENVRTDAVARQRENWDASVYAKPHLGREEQERIDFGRFNAIQDQTVDRLISQLDKTMPALDGLIINQQLAHGIHGDYMIEKLGRLIRRFEDKVILLDARDIPDRYDHVICKINAGEAAKLCGRPIKSSERLETAVLVDYAKQIYEKMGRQVIVTQSERGALAYDGRQVYDVPGILIMGQIDPCGAGDTTAAAITSALAAGAGLGEAIELGNYAAAVIVKKLCTTGTANRDEILETFRNCDYVYNPELSEDIRKSRYWKDTEIEIINPQVRLGSIRHVIFDHDGTISTLRQGWEQIMEPVMVRAILGSHYEDAPEDLYHRVVDRVRRYIDQSTGVETIVQMEALVEMVKQFGLVPSNQILDAMGYKAIYNKALLEMVHRRLAKLKHGELDRVDYTLKGAAAFVQALHALGLTLYLASGTDDKDVLNEAETLGYAAYFDDRIYGWAGEGTGSAKRMVIEQIIRDHALKGPELACIGDGPVELRLCKRADGIALGVASDEVRRYGLNAAKRTRLVKAGADLIVPDFSQGDRLIDLIIHQRHIDPAELHPAI